MSGVGSHQAVSDLGFDASKALVRMRTRCTVLAVATARVGPLHADANHDFCGTINIGVALYLLKDPIIAAQSPSRSICTAAIQESFSLSPSHPSHRCSARKSWTTGTGNNAGYMDLGCRDITCSEYLWPSAARNTLPVQAFFRYGRQLHLGCRI